MIEKDHFGLEAERRITKSGIRKIFTPHQPIQKAALFFGRSKEVRAIIGYLNTPGQHALLFGNRGVGKSSLANVIADYLVVLRPGARVIKKRCDSSDTFITIVGSALQHVGVNIQNTSITEVQKSGLTKVIDLSKARTTNSGGDAERALSPSWVAVKLNDLNAIFVIDEVDALKTREDKEKIAELIKQLSDNGSVFKILVVGIAETANELTAGHPSVSRCLKEVHLANMLDTEIEEIITKGAAGARISFKSSVVNRIVKLSAGYPHFTHLIALKCAELIISEDRHEVFSKDLSSALENCTNDVEGSLKQSYHSAVRSQSGEYKRILLAMALCGGDEIKAHEVREKYKELFGTEVSQGTLNNHFQRLVGEDGEKIVKRLAKGIYKFNDPRMPSYIKIAQCHIQ